MAELYLSLVSGRTVHVCSDWDGAAPTRIGTVDAAGAPDDGEGIEAGEYYRDIHRLTSEVQVYDQTTNVNGGLLAIKGALVPGGVTLKGFAGGTTGSASGTVNALAVKPSDEVANEKPRGWQKVSTWLVFTGTTGVYHWRAASVDGWSSKAPIE